MGNVSDAMKKHQAEEAAKAGVAASEPAEQPPEAVREEAGARQTRFPFVPDGSGTDGYSPLLLPHHDRGGTVAEEYRGLRTSLLSQCPDQRFCYVITSAVVGEGKTVTCLNLGLVMAERQEYRTIVVDFDCRKKKMAGLLAARATPGIADVLRGKARLQDVVQPTAYANLFLIPAGQARSDELGELVTRPELDEAVAELRRSYDYVLFDTPPVNVVSETAMMGRAVGEALVVVRMNRTHRESVEKAIRLLHAANVKVVGMVLTHRKYHIPGYLYRYS